VDMFCGEMEDGREHEECKEESEGESEGEEGEEGEDNKEEEEEEEEEEEGPEGGGLERDNNDDDEDLAVETSRAIMSCMPWLGTERCVHALQ
jgi:hypothetical protein